MKWEWLNKWLQRPYVKVVEELDNKFITNTKDISEPVISIVESFKERGRWVISSADNPFQVRHYGSGYKFIAEDKVTGEKYNLTSPNYIYLHTRFGVKHMIRFPYGASRSTLPSWMTKEEKEYVAKAFEKISAKVKERFQLAEDRSLSKDEKQAKVNQDKERQRLMSLYCKEKTE